MNDLIVIMGATQVRGLMNMYLSQLKDAGIETHVLDCSDKPNLNGGGNLGYRVKIFRQLANQFRDYEKMVVSDAFDICFFGQKSDVLAKIPTDRLIHAAEKNCYPDESCFLPIPDNGPWRYANGGLVAGTPEHFDHWCTYTERHPLYDPTMLDQHMLNIQVSEGVGCLPDYRTDLFYCAFGEQGELEFEKSVPVNRIYETHPAFVHFNGSYHPGEILEKWERSLR